MSGRYNPIEELERILDRMSRQVTGGSPGWDRGGSLAAWAGGDDQFPVDVVDEGDRFVATIDLPGFEREDVSIHLHEQTLQIEADHTSEADEETGSYVRRERRQRSVTRSIRLPDAVNEDDVEAKMHNGVITITLPKLMPDEGHEIDISIE